jgi:hypothetical protein
MLSIGMRRGMGAYRSLAFSSQVPQKVGGDGGHGADDCDAHAVEQHGSGHGK